MMDIPIFLLTTVTQRATTGTTTTTSASTTLSIRIPAVVGITAVVAAATMIFINWLESHCLS